MGLIQEGGIGKFPTRILLQKDSLKIKGAGSFLKNSDGFFSRSQVKCLQKFGGCDYKDNTRMILNKLFTCEMISELNLKDNDKKVGITDIEISKVMIGKLFVYCKMRMKFLWSLLFFETV